MKTGCMYRIHHLRGVFRPQSAILSAFTFQLLALVAFGQSPSNESTSNAYFRETPRSILQVQQQAPIEEKKPAIQETLGAQQGQKTTQQERKIQPVDFGFAPIDKVDVNIRPKLKDATPEDLAGKLFANEQKVNYQSQPIHHSFVQSQAPAPKFCYQPLYFEELNLERHGKRVRWAQPALSGVRFLTTVPFLPYKMANRPPWTHRYTTDPYPSGMPAPWVPERSGLTAKATAAEILAIAITVMILP